MKKWLLASLTVVCFFPIFLVSSQASAYQYLYSCGPIWTNLPVKYQLNEKGSKDFASFSTLETIFVNSFDIWGEPCCSRFSADYTGTTTQTAVSTQNSVVISFEENNWPAQFGNVNQTIAVTLSTVFNNCTIHNAPILFNGVGFRFSNNGTHTDLQSVATHEVGHLLGLGHSQVRQATMYFSYVGGTSARTLHQDDIDGVCSLYERACTCTLDEECPSGESCVGGKCERVPCTSDSQCAPGLECVQGDCVVPPCNSDSDCEEGFKCEKNACVSKCAVCRPCETRADCGGNGFCTQMPGGNRCIVMCREDGVCPGDSQCYNVRSGGESYYMCLAPDAGNDFCPQDYVCQEEPEVAGCPGLGAVCNEDASSCHRANDVCIVFSSGPDICSCTCTTDEDCGEGNHCGDLSGGQKGCYVGPRDSGNGDGPSSPSDPSGQCGGVTCGANQQCVNNQCVDNTNGNGGQQPSGDNNQSGTGSPSSPSGEGPGASDDDLIIVVEDEPTAWYSCSTTPHSTPSLPIALLVVIGAAFWARTRTKVVQS